jgi:DNA-binding MarR family transcriptional regulator
VPLTSAERGFLDRGQVPLIGLLTTVARWWEERHLELLAEAGFGDLRRAHNAIIVHLPASGRRLTDLAELAGMTKQGAAQLVDDLVAKGYLERQPDPTDGRAKLIVWSDRGRAAHRETLRIFGAMEEELERLVGARTFAALRRSLWALFTAVVAADPE